MVSLRMQELAKLHPSTPCISTVVQFPSAEAPPMRKAIAVIMRGILEMESFFMLFDFAVLEVWLRATTELINP
jgi:hypothetical protein